MARSLTSPTQTSGTRVLGGRGQRRGPEVQQLTRSTILNSVAGAGGEETMKADGMEPGRSTQVNNH